MWQILRKYKKSYDSLKCITGCADKTHFAGLVICIDVIKLYYMYIYIYTLYFSIVIVATYIRIIQCALLTHIVFSISCIIATYIYIATQ